MPEGAAERILPGDPVHVFAFLADPRNAQAWFTGADFEAPPEGEPRAGMTWTLAKTEETRGPIPTRTCLYEPPARFAWETALSRMRTNWTWTVSCAPVPGASGAPATHIRLAIRLRPGLLDTLLAFMLARTLRETLSTRAERTLERADTALARQRSGGKQPDSSGHPSRPQRKAGPKRR